MATAKQREAAEAVERMREWVKPGDTLYTILRHVSRSGMSRSISVVTIDHADGGRIYDLDYNVARALGEPIDRDRGGVKVSGCGMDMGFHLVYSLSHALFPDGFGCVGESCPSNDHSNGDRDYTPSTNLVRCDCLDRPGYDGLGRVHERCSGTGYVDVGNPDHWHSSGGYALRQRWL